MALLQDFIRICIHMTSGYTDMVLSPNNTTLCTNNFKLLEQYTAKLLNRKLSETTWGQQPAGGRGRGESHGTPASHPGELAPTGRTLAPRPRVRAAGLYPRSCLTVGGRPGFNRGPGAPLIRASAEAPPVSVRALGRLTSPNGSLHPTRGSSG
jgi:hypothetical protein